MILLAAADEFQDLTGYGNNEAVSWLRALGHSRKLTTCHHTNKQGLLDAVNATRNGLAPPYPEAGYATWPGDFTPPAAGQGQMRVYLFPDPHVKLDFRSIVRPQ